MGLKPEQWNIWWTLSTVFLALGLLFAALEVLGFFGEVGLVLTLASFCLALYFGLRGATRASVGALESVIATGFGAQGERLDRMTERLDRIATILEERLPGSGR